MSEAVYTGRISSGEQNLHRTAPQYSYRPYGDNDIRS